MNRTYEGILGGGGGGCWSGCPMMLINGKEA